MEARADAGQGRTARKAEDVGGPVLPAPAPVQGPDAAVVGEKDGELHVLEIEGPEEAGSALTELREVPRNTAGSVCADLHQGGRACTALVGSAHRRRC